MPRFKLSRVKLLKFKMQLKIFDTSENEIKFKSFIKLPLFFARVLFFDFKSMPEGSTLRERRLYYVKKFYVFFCLLNLMWCVVSFLISAANISGDLVSVSSRILDSLTTFNLSLRGIITFYRKDDIMKLFYELKAMFDSHVNNNTKYGVKNYLTMYQFYIMMYFALVIFMILPIAFPIYQFFAQGIIETSLKFWYPFDVCKTSLYPFHLIYLQWNTFNDLFYALMPDAMLYALMTVIITELGILKDDLMNFSEVPKDERKEKIKSLTDRHNRLLAICDELQNIYTVSFLTNFVVSSMILCFVAFNLTTAGNDILTYSYYVPYMAIMGLHILLLCFFGQKLTDASEAVADGIYFNEWEALSESNFKKQFILIMMRAQKPKRLSAMGFTDISLTTFSAVNIKNENIFKAIS